MGIANSHLRSGHERAGVFPDAYLADSTVPADRRGPDVFLWAAHAEGSGQSVLRGERFPLVCVRARGRTDYVRATRKRALLPADFVAVGNARGHAHGRGHGELRRR